MRSRTLVGFRGLLLLMHVASFFCLPFQVTAQIRTNKAELMPVRGSGAAIPQALPSGISDPIAKTDELGSVYIPVDSWVYPAALRLYSLGYLDSVFISMRPWTRRSLLQALALTRSSVMNGNEDQAQEIYASLTDYLETEQESSRRKDEAVYGVDTIYMRLMGVDGTSLRDSFHLGQTINNDYGRPYEPGFNMIAGVSTSNEWGPFSLAVRGEYQYAPSAAGYSQSLSATLSKIDTPYGPTAAVTIQPGPNAAQNNFRLVEATLSTHFLGNEISGGKSDLWSGPGYGGAMGWSNNAENIYSFRINRVEPLHVPYFSSVFGPIRYDFMVGSLKGHSYPNSPWIHQEMFSLRPTTNLQFSFQRSVIWGGEGHVPVTLHTFLRSFFSLSDTENDPSSKGTSADPGARFSIFSFSWRLPYLRKYVTLYTDSIAHDDVSPISAPRRAAYRPGVYISQIPRLNKFDFRIEGVSTDTSTLRSLGGQFNYWELIQLQGYTNKGLIIGDWIGREAKGGQAWVTRHLSGNEYIQASFEYKKTPKDFIPGGTTQQQGKLAIVKRLRPELELNAYVQGERWVAPIYKNGSQHDVALAGQLIWYPALSTHGSR